MKKITSQFIKLILGLLFMFNFIACDEGGDPNPGATEVVEMTGDWYVQLLVDGEDVYGIGYYLLSTYNTSANNGNEMWIDDHELWPFKVKASVNVSAKTFEGSGLENEYSYEDELEDGTEVDVFPIVTITSGQIIKGGATTSGGNPSDSISFTIEFSDDPGTIYTIEGYKRTGFLEDEH